MSSYGSTESAAAATPRVRFDEDEARAPTLRWAEREQGGSVTLVYAGEG